MDDPVNERDGRMWGEERRQTPTRRALLGASALALVGATAGCPGQFGPDAPDTSGTPTRVSTPGESPQPTGTPTPSGTDAGSSGPGTTPTDTPPSTSTPTPEGPDELYVAPDGDDGNPGSRDAPLAGLSAALARAVPGTTVRLRGGTYNPDRTVGARGLAGTAEEPVVVTAEPDEGPVFDFAAADVGGLRFSDCRWLELRGFTVRNAPSRGLFVEDGSTDVRVENVAVWASGGDPNASGTGVFVLDSTDVTLRNVYSQNNYDPSSGGHNADGIAVERSPGTLVDACVARGNSDDGIDLWETTGETVRRCWSYDNGYDPDGNAAGDGNGFKLGGGDASGDSVVRRCVAFDNRVRGFDDNGATRPVTLYNCTAWRNPVAFRLGCHFDVADPSCPAHRLRNNLHAGGDVQLSPFVDSAANAWDLGIDDPGFASTDRDDDDYLHLSADSPAVDAGVDVGVSYRGDAPDLGAFEFDPASTPTDVDPTSNSVD